MRPACLLIETGFLSSIPHRHLCALTYLPSSRAGVFLCLNVLTETQFRCWQSCNAHDTFEVFLPKARAVTDVTGSALAEALRDRYVFERELGRGGMATVYLANDLRHHRQVAIKVLDPHLALGVGPDRFRLEIETAARLEHPHIVPVLDSGEAGGWLWYAMPWVEGESLRARLERAGPLPVDEALRLTREAADALDCAHRHGVVHRDVKPENILLSGGHARVADFGIARALEAAGDERLTGTGISIGTPAYMSPEQAGGTRTLDGRSDIYSLGCVLYELLTGEPPFTGPTPQAVIGRRFIESPRPVRGLRSSVPEAVEAALTRALARDLDDRFPTAAEFGQALAEPAAGMAASVSGALTRPVTTAERVSPSTPASSRSRGRFPARMVLLGIGILLGLGVLFVRLRSRAEGGGAAESNLLAVLPFENLGDSAEAYFADGVSDAVRGKLAALPGFQVIAGTTSRQYRHSTKSPQEVARELGVRYLLVGTVRPRLEPGEAGWVTVSSELIEVGPRSTPRTRWQEPVDAPVSDVFRVQSDIARGVAEVLGVRLDEGARLQLAKPPTDNLAAYRAFLRGEQISDKLETIDPGTIRRALTYYEQAVALDTGFVEAWGQLSRAHSTLYFNGGAATPVEAEAARAAAGRAVALGPGRPEGRLAQGLYYLAVPRDNARALEQFTLGLRSAPNHVELLSWAGLAEQYLGRWEAALGHFRRAYALDPRSLSAARPLAYAYLMTRRYPEALAVVDRALALGVTPRFVHLKAMIHLAEGDLRQARADLRAGLGLLEAATLVATFGYGWDLYWVLEEPEQQLLLRLPPGAFDDNRASWGLALAQTYALRGDQAHARAYADTARRAFEEQLAASPTNSELVALHGVTLAYLGRKAEAVREGERAVALTPLGRHAESVTEAYVQHQLVRIYLLIGEPEKALDRLEPLLRIPYYLSPGWLRVDPTFDPLRRQPRFERLVAGK
jgi:serine/threonine protein kinase/tetratricopeptide (TPR) repeat protein